MFYDIESGPIPAKLTSSLIKQLEDDAPIGLEATRVKGDTYKLQVSLHDEGFDLDAVAPFLKCATRKGKLRVTYSDHEGANSYDVQYGPGICKDLG
jgi:hypothetical protein